MADQLNAAPSINQYISRETLDGVQYRLRFTFGTRRQQWTMDISQADDTPIMSGRRLSAGFSATSGLLPPDKPTGEFFVRGFDGYAQADLGTGLQVVFYADSELVADPVASTVIFALAT